MRRAAFTLLELVMALAASAVILAAIYGVFSRAVHLRDEATARVREARIRGHAASVIRDDLRNALISGSTTATALGSTLTGSQDSKESSFPGYLAFTTTTGRDAEATPTADVQKVEYFITNDPEAVDRNSGMLVRTVERTILAQTPETPLQVPLLHGLEKMEIEFYDGSSWQNSWQITETEKTLPEAVRVRLQPASSLRGEHVSPIEIVVPWTTKSWIES